MKLPGWATYSSTTSCCLCLATVLIIQSVRGNAISNDCVVGLQTTCVEEINSLEKSHGKEACSFLSKAISCVACKMPNCTELVDSIVETYAQEPYFCELKPDDVILLQKGEASVKLCLLLKPTTMWPPGKEPQVQDGGNGSGNNTATRPVLYHLALWTSLASLTLPTVYR